MMHFLNIIAMLAAYVFAENYTNSVLWEDLADLDVIRVNDTFYYSASTMHYSPGAPVLKSYDLVNWEYIGHSVPILDWSSKYDLTDGQRAYVKGIWASSLNYRNSTGEFYWIGCIEFGTTYVYTAPAAAGPWTKRSSINTCYYDVGLLIDDDDTMYTAYGNTNISVAQLSPDGLSQVRTQQVYASDFYIEGSRFYKINGYYYIFNTRPANGQYILKSSSPWGPYEISELLLDIPTPIGGGGVPHQGGLVSTQNGDWYYMGFIDAYPGGRVPALAPITWGSDGFPMLVTNSTGGFGVSYEYPLPKQVLQSFTGTDKFTGPALGPEWEWNHNPDMSKFSVGNGLELQTATVTNDLYQARNTLTHRILGPRSSATILLDYSGMANGDRAGLSLFRDSSAWVGIVKDTSGVISVAMVTNITMNQSDWSTNNTGVVAHSSKFSLPDSNGKIWLRASPYIQPGAPRPATFSYSTDGKSFTDIGPEFIMGNTYYFFMGYRYGIFNYATEALGGKVTIEEFTMAQP